MSILIAPDKFKGSLSAQQVCDAIRQGLLVKQPSVKIISIPLADGGEGTLEVILKNTDADQIEKIVTGPLFDPVKAHYAFSASEETAYIEMAQASGLQLIPLEKRNPLKTTSLGTGELIHDALNRRATSVVIGLGGSATNDAGIGMASALGYEFLDKHGRILLPIGENLKAVHSIKSTQAERLRHVKFLALTDVTNPLSGNNGAAHVFAEQKGASAPEVMLLDEGLENFEEVCRREFGQSVQFPGAGAAGGMGAGCKVFLNARIAKGMDYIGTICRLQDHIRESGLIITGEGKLDTQSFSGKVVGEVVRLSKLFNKKLIVVCGISSIPEPEWRAQGIDRVIAVGDAEHEEFSIKNAFQLIVDKISAAADF